MEFKSVRGMRDILPADQDYWLFAKANFEAISSSLGFNRLDVPSIEASSLFKRSIGSGTDIVEKELFDLVSRKEEGDQLSLRPELTAGCVRAFLENGMTSLPKPVRLYLMGQVYRYDRPQKNRFREFYQLDLEVLGDASAKYDFLIIQTTLNYLKSLGLQDLSLSINSIGCQTCRPVFRQRLLDYFNEHVNDYCEDCQRRAEQNPLRILDCKNEKCQAVSLKAPKSSDYLCPYCKAHHSELTSLLSEFDIDYQLDPFLVRGLDYYNRTVFEISLKDDTSRQGSIAGGGRFDKLVEELGGSPTPAVGAAIGLDRVVNALKEGGIEVPVSTGVKVMIIGVGDSKKECQSLYKKFVEMAIVPYYLPTNESLSKQLESANKLKTHFAVIIGEDEVKSGEYILKDLRSGEQIKVAKDKLLEKLED
jgi:histidyl-tRNA synthetase